jgi:hypothetical protein
LTCTQYLEDKKELNSLWVKKALQKPQNSAKLCIRDQACPASILSRWAWIFFSGSVDQSAVGIIDMGADIYVNLGGTMVTGFIHHCVREGLSSNPGVPLVFFSSPM